MSLPLGIFGVHKSFYINPDPDLVYITNAVLFLKNGTIAYIDHPGTPTIFLISLLAFPVKVATSVFWHQDFTTWSFNNYEVLSFYLRVFQLTASGAALFLFLKLTNKLTSSKVSVLFAFLLYFASGIFSWSTYVAPEPILLFITVVWLYFAYRYIDAPNFTNSLILSGLSGIAFANKFTALVLPLGTLFLFLVFSKKGEKLKNIITGILAFLNVFILSILPVLPKLKSILVWAKNLFIHSGPYGQGPAGIFQIQTYTRSLFTLVKTYPAVFIIILVGIIVAIKFFRKTASKKDLLFSILFLTSFAIFLIFCKYPKVHYNYVNLLIIIFCISYWVPKLKDIWVKILTPIFIFMFMATLFLNTKDLLNKRIIAGDKENSYMHQALETWTPSWSGNVYEDQIKK